MRCAVVAGDTCFGYKGPAFVAVPEKTGESVAEPISVFAGCVVGRITGFITWRSPCESGHRFALGAEECSGSVGHSESGGFAFDNAAPAVGLRENSVPECNVVVGYFKNDVEYRFSVLGESEFAVVGRVVDMTFLDIRKGVGVFDHSLVGCPDERQTGRVVSDIGD